ncbi:MAG: hypothetical protein AB7O66_22855 [Limisphaerales bacterium]
MAERKAFLLRIDPSVWAELEAWAESELRSVNGQVEFVLREALQRRRGRSLPVQPAREPPPRREGHEGHPGHDGRSKGEDPGPASPS